jgi:hypothetical protein
MVKKNNLHLAIIRIIPYTKSISRVDEVEHSLVAAKKATWKGQKSEGKSFRWWRSEGWKSETSSQSCVVCERLGKNRSRLDIATHLAEYISGFSVLGGKVGSVGVSDGFCM